MLATQLKQANISPSVHRLAIYKYMMEHHTHPSVEVVYAALSPSMPTLSKTTVYNTLKLFAEKGLVQLLTISDKCVRFDGKTSAHAHFFCNTCGELYDLPLEPSQEMKLQGFEIEQTYYSGICPHCKRNNNN